MAPCSPQQIAGGLPSMRYWIGNCCIPASSVQNPITFRMIRQLANAVKLTTIILGCGSGVIGATPGGPVGSKDWATSPSLGTSHQISALREPASVLSRPCLFFATTLHFLLHSLSIYERKFPGNSCHSSVNGSFPTVRWTDAPSPASDRSCTCD